MIVVFVVDTSPSMGQALVSDGSTGMSRLDLAKMAVESLAKGLRKRVSEHNGQLQQETLTAQQSLHNLGLGHCPNHQFLLLSTGRQKSGHPGAAACGAGGRLLVGYGDSIEFHVDSTSDMPPMHANHGGFDRSLKHLQATEARQPFPEDGGGAVGLNAAMNAGIMLMSRYRLNNRTTENFGLGRFPSSAMLNLSGSGPTVNALMPACLVLLTDGECLRKKPPAEGGGSLQLQYGSGPLREFYQEPFRWDQRIFCLGVGAPEGITSSQYVHGDLRRLCDVTGGCHAVLRSSSGLAQQIDSLLKIIAPPRPRDMPIPYPLRTVPPPQQQLPTAQSSMSSGLFLNGGPICCFQGLEAGPNGEPSPTRRAMLLYVPFEQPQATPGPKSEPSQYFPPMWCIPESFFPSKKLDTLPPRPAQPLLRFSGNYSVIGSSTFDPGHVMKLLQRLDQLTLANRKLAPASSTAQQQSTMKLLHRDVYICEWLSEDGWSASPPRGPRGMEYFPVCVQGAGRPLSEGDEHFLNIGILHVPQGVSSLAQQQSPGARFATLTLLPPEPQILLPLLVKAAEAEQRVLRKSAEAKEATAGRSGATAGLIQMQSSASFGGKSVHLDDQWRSDFRAYLFRVPPYYHNAIKRSLRPILPASVQSLLNLDGIEALASHCFSKVCLQKIRNGEQVARDKNERLERQEAELRSRGIQQAKEQPNKNAPNARQPQTEASKSSQPVVGYGQYDPRDSTTSYLAALRTMPAPWRVKGASRTKEKDLSIVESTSQDGVSDTASIASVKDPPSKTAVDVLGDLPADCLLPYYESRRRWIFGGSGLTTRGLFVEGVNSDGSNVQYYGAHHSIEDEPLLSIAGVGASTLNKTTTAKMGDFRERLLWSRPPIVGYGSNDAAGVSATTSPDGSPKWSVDDDALPMTFFDPRTGEFSDSVQTRVSARVIVNFGNPYTQNKRGDAIVPEAFLSQSPSFKRGDDWSDDGPHTPPGSPPHDAFTSTEGEDEAVVFTGKPLRKPSPHHDSSAFLTDDSVKSSSDLKRPREEKDIETTGPQQEKGKPQKKAKTGPPPPPPPGPAQRPPPPPKPPQKKHPPKPPPPRPPPRSPAEKRPGDTKPPSRPPAPKSATPDKPRPMEAAKTAEMNLQDPNHKPNVHLPPGWAVHWSTTNKRWYFFHIKTKESIWQWPPPGGLQR